ncbi:DUF4102 domain-containing protein [Salmonella enterica]|nr:DUF4102 domain-containing protein [Salmonella enterica]EDX2009365.1 DUF4102 domain-containing protein [Salmonella enterica subsp. enterica]EEK1479686.1 DUF4102 domain-containing protein [Salmonella enterica subsp. enterica serovar Typhimurium]EHB8802732.1 integrase arm-type DNA-binding domain-containing protein [Salmonella enterica subsp. enterica serovar Rough O:z4,z23:-]EAX9869706.1 DUF4102 domain-containing protein [Salmonella enterica]
MAVLTRPLSASEVQKAKPAEKDYELFDGQGLTLFVRSSGKKIWRFRYKRPASDARTTITLGYYPSICRDLSCSTRRICTFCARIRHSQKRCASAMRS